MLFDPCNKCIVKVMCKDTCEKKVIYANKFDNVTRTAAFIFVVGSYVGFILWIAIQ